MQTGDSVVGQDPCLSLECPRREFNKPVAKWDSIQWHVVI